MKIVDVNPFFYPYKGGIEHRMHDTSRLLAAKGHKVTILTGQLPNTAEEEKSDGYDIIRLKSKLIDVYNPPFISSEGVFDTLQSLDADIVNFNYRWAPSYSKDLAKYDGKKVFTYHNVWGEGVGIQSTLSEMNDNKFAKILDTFDHIIAVSDFVRNDLIARGYNEECVTAVPTGLPYVPEAGDGKGDYILSLGRLVRTKGIDYLIQAMVDVDCKLIICGIGPEYKKLDKEIKKLELEDKVEIKGWVPEEEKKELMKSCKFFVIPSLFESLGLTAIETISYGRPVVYTNVNGLPSVVGDGGLCIPPANPKALAEAINKLLNDDTLTEKMGTNAFDRSKAYAWDLLLPKIEEVYQKVVDGTLTGPLRNEKKGPN